MKFYKVRLFKKDPNEEWVYYVTAANVVEALEKAKATHKEAGLPGCAYNIIRPLPDS